MAERSKTRERMEKNKTTYKQPLKWSFSRQRRIPIGNFQGQWSARLLVEIFFSITLKNGNTNDEMINNRMDIPKWATTGKTILYCV